MRTKIKPLLLWTLASCLTLCYACDGPNDDPIPNNASFLPRLSEYGIYRGRLADLVPADSFHLYELATPLFTDYAEKQRLIRLPAGTTLTARGDGLPEFPEGTLLVKTFYYPLDENNLARGRRILETRLLQKRQGRWNVATYQWNPAQTEADLVTTGADVPVTWKDSEGATRTLSYHIPSNAECTSCHRSGNQTVPIGPKLRNLNRTVRREGGEVNQLEYLRNHSVLATLPASVMPLPAWDDPGFSLPERARAYLDVNCAHCHNGQGMAGHKNLELGYEVPFRSTRIRGHKQNIILRMESSNPSIRMPKLGTTIPHDEGIDLIRKYLQSL